VVVRAIATILTSFGIEEEDRREMRADFQHLRRWRKSVEQAQSYTFKAVITVIVTGFVGAVWLASRSCSANDLHSAAYRGLAALIPCAGHSLLGREESRRAIWRGGCGILGTREGYFRQGNREGEAMPQIRGPLLPLPLSQPIGVPNE